MSVDWDSAWDHLYDLLGDVRQACAEFTKDNRHWVVKAQLDNYPPRFTLKAYVPSPEDSRYAEMYMDNGVIARRDVPEQWVAQVSSLVASLATDLELRPFSARDPYRRTTHQTGTMSGYLHWEIRPDYEEFEGDDDAHT